MGGMPIPRLLLFHLLTHFPNDQKFALDKLIWKFKVKSFLWTVVLDRINTNDLLQIWRPKSNIYVMCMDNLESVAHLFLLCPIANSLWNRLFSISGEQWVCLNSPEGFLTIRF